MLTEKTFNPARQNSIKSFTPVRNSLLQRKCACGGSSGTGQCAECSKKEGTSLQRSTIGNQSVTGVSPIVHEVLRSPGQPLDHETRAFFEPRFGHDFSQVRVHTNAQAEESARAVNALAYTIGRNVVFGAGQYAPGTHEGARLIAHELSHVKQQGQSKEYSPMYMSVSEPGDAAESEAGRIADLVMSEGQACTAMTNCSTPVLQRKTSNTGSRTVASSIPDVCGPDATDWFIRQVNAAKKDPVVLEIQANLAGAHRVAARFGFSAERVAEGAVSKKVLAEETRAGSPLRTAEATTQIAASSPGREEFGRAVIAATAPIPFAGAPEQIVLLAIRRAAIAWKNLVGTGKRYDFKNDSRTMKGPTSAHCPTGCANTITLCPSMSSGCFRTDVPGNLFYAHVGHFVGWTELSLQLGSEFAQLESTKTWDPPDDTRMISIGFSLPHPLTPAAFCGVVTANRSSFILRPCGNCPEPTTAAIV